MIMIDISNVVKGIYRLSHEFRSYPKGLYKPTMIEPIALNRDLVIEDDRRYRGEDLSNIDKLYHKTDFSLVYDRQKNYIDRISNLPYHPYLPYKIVREYVGNFLYDKNIYSDIIDKCPITNRGPLENYYYPLSTEEYIKYVLDIQIDVDIYSILNSIKPFLLEIEDIDTKVFDITLIPNTLILTPVATPLELRYIYLLEEKENELQDKIKNIIDEADIMEVNKMLRSISEAINGFKDAFDR